MHVVTNCIKANLELQYGGLFEPFGCLFLWVHNPMGHDEDVVFAWVGVVCDVLHRIGEKVPNVIYVWVHLNLVDAF